jgi:hypothetical protein
MKGHLWKIAKTVVKSQLDIYVLPGTTTGTEILLLYIAQWKRDIALATTATLSLVFSQKDLPDYERVSSPQPANHTENVHRTLS